jgi:hypothetical protein
MDPRLRGGDERWSLWASASPRHCASAQFLVAAWDSYNGAINQRDVPLCRHPREGGDPSETNVEQKYCRRDAEARRRRDQKKNDLFLLLTSASSAPLRDHFLFGWTPASAGATNDGVSGLRVAAPLRLRAISCGCLGWHEGRPTMETALLSGVRGLCAFAR